MGFAPQQPPPRPTLEELLQFKRTERPAPEFWAEFDRGLRKKQLAALMRHPQGWARIRPLFIHSLRWVVPATAAAAVALVVVQIPLSTASRSTPMEVASLPVRSAPASVAPGADIQALLATTNAAHQSVVQAASAGTVAASAEPVGRATQVASVSQPDEHSLPWSATTLPHGFETSFRPTETFVVQPASRETRRPRSSWNSRFNEMVQVISAEQSTDRLLQLASFSLPAVTDPASTVAPADSGLAAYASNTRAARAPADRDFRDLDTRIGVSGSSLSIKF